MIIGGKRNEFCNTNLKIKDLNIFYIVKLTLMHDNNQTYDIRSFWMHNLSNS